MSKSYIVRENPDGTRYFDENTPTGQISPSTIGAGLRIDSTGKVEVDDTTVMKLSGAQTVTDTKTFTSSPEVPTATVGDNSTKVANTAFVAGAVAGLVAKAGDTMTGALEVPTPALTENSTKVATTAWVKSVLPGSNGFKVNSDGTIEVDFSQMDVATINNIRKQMGVKVPLAANKDFYVDGVTGSDTLDDGRGESSAKPFKTIQACANYVCATYDLLRFNATINVTSGLYEETLSLGGYTSTTGVIQIQPVSGRVTVKTTRTSGATCSAAYGAYTLSNFDFECAANNPSSAAIVQVFRAARGATVTCSNCSFTLSEASVSSNFNNAYAIEVDGASFSLREGARISCVAPHARNASGYNVINDSILSFQYGNSATEASYPIVASGMNYNAATGIVSSNSSVVLYAGTWSVKPDFTTGSSVTGFRYKAINGGNIDTRGGGDNYFPGTIAGTVETATYSWYK